MANRLIRRIWNNLGTLGLSLALALAVWISAVVAADPNEECALPGQVSLEITGKKADLLLLAELPRSVSVRLQAPSSICRELASQPELIQAAIDLSGIPEGEFVLPVEIHITTQPVRVLEVLPREIPIVLEIDSRIEFPIILVVTGEPPRGFQTESPVLEIEQAQISGPHTLVEQVSEVWAELDIAGSQTTISEDVTLIAVDENGQVISGVTIEPQTVGVTQSIVQSGGFRTVAVKVETVGQPESGYRLTNIQVSPPTVTISSSDPQLVDGLPGFVSTLPLDLSELTDNTEVRLSLVLPPDVFVEGEQTVLVFVGITALEGTALLSAPVEIIGLGAGLEAHISPETVDVFLSGPVAILNLLTSEDVRVFADLSDQEEVGTYLVELTVEILPDRIELDSINPSTVEVTLTIRLTPAAEPTQTPTPIP